MKKKVVKRSLTLIFLVAVLSGNIQGVKAFGDFGGGGFSDFGPSFSDFSDFGGMSDFGDISDFGGMSDFDDLSDFSSPTDFEPIPSDMSDLSASPSDYEPIDLVSPSDYEPIITVSPSDYEPIISPSTSGQTETPITPKETNGGITLYGPASENFGDALSGDKASAEDYESIAPVSPSDYEPIISPSTSGQTETPITPKETNGGITLYGPASENFGDALAGDKASAEDFEAIAPVSPSDYEPIISPSTSGQTETPITPKETNGGITLYGPASENFGDALAGDKASAEDFEAIAPVSPSDYEPIISPSTSGQTETPITPKETNGGITLYGPASENFGDALAGDKASAEDFEAIAPVSPSDYEPIISPSTSGQTETPITPKETNGGITLYGPASENFGDALAGDKASAEDFEAIAPVSPSDYEPIISPSTSGQTETPITPKETNGGITLYGPASENFGDALAGENQQGQDKIVLYTPIDGNSNQNNIGVDNTNIETQWTKDDGRPGLVEIPRTVTVQKGDSLERIGKRLYPDNPDYAAAASAMILQQLDEQGDARYSKKSNRYVLDVGATTTIDLSKATPKQIDALASIYKRYVSGERREDNRRFAIAEARERYEAAIRAQQREQRRIAQQREQQRIAIARQREQQRQFAAQQRLYNVPFYLRKPGPSPLVANNKYTLIGPTYGKYSGLGVLKNPKVTGPYSPFLVGGKYFDDVRRVLETTRYSNSNKKSELPITFGYMGTGIASIPAEAVSADNIGKIGKELSERGVQEGSFPIYIAGQFLEKAPELRDQIVGTGKSIANASSSDVAEGIGKGVANFIPDTLNGISNIGKEIANGWTLIAEETPFVDKGSLAGFREKSAPQLNQWITYDNKSQEAIGSLAQIFTPSATVKAANGVAKAASTVGKGASKVDNVAGSPKTTLPSPSNNNPVSAETISPTIGQKIKDNLANSYVNIKDTTNNALAASQNWFSSKTSNIKNGADNIWTTSKDWVKTTSDEIGRILTEPFNSTEFVTPDGVRIRPDASDAKASDYISQSANLDGNTNSWSLDSNKDYESKDIDSTEEFPQVHRVEYGEQFRKGVNGRKELRSNVEYTGPKGYQYSTDNLGRINSVRVDDLAIGKGERNYYSQRISGRDDRLSDDDGGHLIASMFEGSGDIDNLVAMNSQINRKGGVWYEMEQEWKAALSENPPRKVSNVKIEPVYSGNSLRPDKFNISYQIEGEPLRIRQIQNKAGG